MKLAHLLILVGVSLAFGGTTLAIITVSRRGLELIKRFEALRLKPYRDQGGKMTIGYGHLIKNSEPGLLDSEGITEAEALALLKSDLQSAENTVNVMVRAPLNGNQFDALTSFVFNIGAGAFSRSTLLKKLNQKNYAGAAYEFARWKFVGKKESAGLIARRAVEQSTFMA